MSDLRSQVRHAVATRTPVDRREEESIAHFLHLYDALAEPFSETAAPVHVTASGFVVGHRGVVLLKHRRLGKWLQPGGHVDPGETPWQAAVREVHEETGLVVDLLDAPGDGAPPPVAHVDVHRGGRGHVHLDLRYLLGGSDDDPQPPAGESPHVHWFDVDAAIARAEPGLAGALGMLRSYV